MDPSVAAHPPRPRRRLVLAALLGLASCREGAERPVAPRAWRDTTTLLFVGNSYTYVNDLPGCFRRTASARGHLVATGQVAEGGWTLAAHRSDSASVARIRGGGWTAVLLQEQSQIPSVPDARRAGMLPAVRELSRLAREAGARPLLFQTWPHRGGWPEQGMFDTRSMGQALAEGYREAAAASGDEVVPVGDAWMALDSALPGLPLWQADGSHPTPVGTWVAACVLHGALFGELPPDSTAPADLPDSTARRVLAVLGALRSAASPSSAREP